MGKKKAFYTYTADGKLYYRKQVIAALYSESHRRSLLRSGRATMRGHGRSKLLWARARSSAERRSAGGEMCVLPQLRTKWLQLL